MSAGTSARKLSFPLNNYLFSPTRSHPSQEGFWLPLLAMEAARTAHFCDVCEVEFAREGELIRHEESHVVCDLDGCTFVACQEV